MDIQLRAQNLQMQSLAQNAYAIGGPDITNNDSEALGGEAQFGRTVQMASLDQWTLSADSIPLHKQARFTGKSW